MLLREPSLPSFVYDTGTMSLFKDTWTSVPLNTFKKHVGLDTATNTNAFVTAQMILGHCKELTTVYTHTLTKIYFFKIKSSPFIRKQLLRAHRT